MIQPPEDAVTRRTHISTTALLVAAAVLVAVTVVAYQSDRGPDTALTAQEANRQYLDESAKWELPSGWQWPTSPIYWGDASGITYGSNSGRIDATLYWFCAWSRTLLSAPTDTDRAAALTQVVRLPQTPFYTVGLPAVEKARLDRAVEAASVGDVRELTHLTEPSCPQRA